MYSLVTCMQLRTEDYKYTLGNNNNNNKRSNNIYMYLLIIKLFSLIAYS